jgi:1-acyl-sn-glycerol-3-phosphate acyltransferase
VIVVANHVSFFDSVLLMFSLPRPVAFIGKAEYTDNPITNWLFCGAGMIPVRRENPGDLPHVFDEVAEVLGRGEVIGVFPEGTRSRDGRLHRGHVGAAHLALTPVHRSCRSASSAPTGCCPPAPGSCGRSSGDDHARRTDQGERPRLQKSTNRARRGHRPVHGRIARLCAEPYVDQYASLHSG